MTYGRTKGGPTEMDGYIFAKEGSVSLEDEGYDFSDVMITIAHEETYITKGDLKDLYKLLQLYFVE